MLLTRKRFRDNFYQIIYSTTINLITFIKILILKNFYYEKKFTLIICSFMYSI
jgi:hypothetical protein